MSYKSCMMLKFTMLFVGLCTQIGASQGTVINQEERTEQWYAPVSREDLLALTDEDQHVREVAQMIIERVYEQGQRPLVNSAGKNNYGYTFSLYPEVTAQLMKSVKGKTVLEIGAGYGENSLLLALAGAERVYINDIEEENFIPLVEDMAMLPQAYQQRIHQLKGDCMSLENKEELHQACDVIIARNIVHYFSGERKERLFKMMARLLKPGGQAFISVNAPFKGVYPELIEQHPDTSVFFHVTPCTSQPGRLKEPIMNLREISVPTITDSVDLLKKEESPLVAFNSTGRVLHHSMSLFSESFQLRIEEFIEQLLKLNGLPVLIASGAQLHCYTGYLVCYTMRTLPQLLGTTPLRLGQALYTDVSGHTTKNEKEAGSLTVVLEKEIKKACFTCGQHATQWCARCKKAYFCGEDCRYAGWKQHKKACSPHQ